MQFFSKLLLVVFVLSQASACRHGTFRTDNSPSPTATATAVEATLPAKSGPLEAEDDVQVFFTPNPAGHSDFVQLVNGARKTVNLAMFRISDQADAQALAAAARRQVQVRVILDATILEANRNLDILTILQTAGVQVKPSSKAFSITHEKAMTIDDGLAMISTINLTNAYSTTRGIGVISKDAALISEFNSVFEADWSNADHETKETPQLQSRHLVWSPVNSVEKIVGLINTSQKSIELYVENFSHPDIAKALEEAAGRGVKVRVLTPLCDVNPNPLLNLPMMRKLNSSGVEARMMGFPSTADQPYIHAKSIVVDGMRTYVGSINFSYNSLMNAREVGIIFSNTKVSGEIRGKFDQDWSVAISPPEQTEGLCSQQASPKN